MATSSPRLQHLVTHDQASHPFDPTRVRYSPRWLGLSAALGAGTLATIALRRGKFSRETVLALGSAAVAGAAYATLFEPRRPVLERVTLQSPNLPPTLDGLRIGQLSDLHLGQPYTAANTRWAVAQMVREQPDLIALTGDFVSFENAIDELADLLHPLNAPLGMYAVPGNHDYWEGLDDIRAELEPLGVEFLINANRQLRWRDGLFTLVGIDDIWDGHPDIDQAMTGIARDTFTILLAHAPDFADVAFDYAIDMQLSGHTHGGHLRLPWLGSCCLPFYGTRYAAGLEHAGTTQVYVSRGLGGMPLRLGCRPEATIITLRHG